MKNLLLLSFLGTSLCLAADPITSVAITSVKMTEEFSTNVELGPGALMKKTLTKGLTLPVVREKSATVIVSSGAVQIEVPSEKTDLEQQKMAHSEKVAADLAKQEAHDKEANTAWEAAHKNQGYQSALKTIDRAEASQDLIVGTDVKDYLLIIKGSKKVIEAHESNDSAAESKANQELKDVFASLLSKNAIAAKYNEFLKSYTATPIIFGLFNNEDRFYLCIGDGDFCTVAPIDPENLQPILEWLAKSRKWTGECYDQKINATKDSPTWGGISFTLTCDDGGRRGIITLHARGPMEHDRLLARQDVLLTMLNVSRLIDKITHSEKLYNDREAAKNNGSLLK